MPESQFQHVGAGQFDSPNMAADFDVVFIHGLFGDLESTWQFADDPQNYWPRWLARDISQINVWAAGYDTKLLANALLGDGPNLADRSSIFLDFLLSKTKGGNLVLIGHSLGGLLIKQMLRQCSDSQNSARKEFLSKVRGVIFIGTPHSGSAVAGSLRQMLKEFLTKDVNQLAYADSELIGLNEWFRNWASSGKPAVRAYYETNKTHGFLVVDKVTANPGVLGCDPTAIEQDHFGICKPASRQSQLYVSTQSFIEGLKAASPPKQNGHVISSPLHVHTDENGTVFLPAEVMRDYQYFTSAAEDDRRALAQKLEDAGRKYEIKEAARKKERFAMTLRHNIAQPASLARYVNLLSQIEGRFNRHVMAAIAKNEPIEAVNTIVQTQVIDPVFKSTQETGLDLTEGVIESALSYLTGNCHIRWDNGKV